jgi:hypothetical protein
VSRAPESVADRASSAGESFAEGTPAAAPAVTALVLTLAGVALVLLTRLVILPRAEGVHAWVISQDAWTPLPAARSIANGDLFHMYEPLVGRTGYPYTPGLPILLAPFAAIGDHFHLLGDYFFQHRHPAMFLLLGPAGVFVGLFPLLFVAGRVAGGRGARTWRVEGLVFLAAAWAPIGWFHPEDTIACALLVAACARTERGDWRVVGALLGGALLFKQWALWPAIPIALAAPPGRRGLTAFYGLVLPALVLAPFLAASSGTWSSLTGTRASLDFGQVQLWARVAFGHRQLADATLLRVLWGAAALVVSSKIGRRPSVDMLLAAVGTVMLLRLLFEPVLFGYYLVPPAVLAIIWCLRNGRPVVLRATTASLLCAFCLPHTFPQPVFFAIVALGLAYVCVPMIGSLGWRREPAESAARTH